MPYLTYDEFSEIAPHITIDEKEYKQLERKASAVLNNVTSFFYVRNDIKKDNMWRVNQFKQALVAQIEYFYEVGSTTSEGINSTPQSFTAGRTSVSNASSYKVTGQNEKKEMIADDVFVFLEGTGLLYCGVAIW